MAKNGRESGVQRWRCSERNREHYIAWYDALPGLAYNRLLLRTRRHKALARMTERRERLG